MKTRKIRARRMKRIGWVNIYLRRVSGVFDSYKYARGVRDTHDGNEYVATVRVYIEK